MGLTKKQLWFWLCNLNGIGTKKIEALLSYYGELPEIFHAKAETLKEITILSTKDREYLSTEHKEEPILREYERMEKNQIQFIIREEEAYPNRLKHLYDAPYGIYVKGTLPKEEQKAIAIVGARECSDYGKEMATYFAKRLSQAGVAVISGLAKGVDGYSHQGALGVNGYTLGILGSGISVCYPRCNYPLYEGMCKRGGILSEYSGYTKPYAGNFPRRNRLIAAMSDGILLVEARERSGSLITVDQGLEQGKNIFVLPGRLTDSLSIGCNRLIRMGAELVTRPEDILEYLQISIDEKKEEKNNKARVNCTKEEEKVLSCLCKEPIHIGSLLEKTGLEVSSLAKILVCLELEDMIVQTNKNYYMLGMNG